MKTIALVIALVLANSASSSACGQTLTSSHKLALHCRTVDEYCRGYMDGYIDAAELYQLWNTMNRFTKPNDNVSFCPASVGVVGFAKGFVNYLAQNPERAAEPSGSVMLDLLTENYACPIQ